MSRAGSDCGLPSNAEIVPEHESGVVSRRAVHKDNLFHDEKQVKPTCNLPSEILSEIFLWCCPTYNDHFRGSPDAPLALSHTCRLWRQAAFSTPALWTYLALTVPYSAEDGTERAIRQLKFWLDRVQKHPLFVDAEFVETPHRCPACNVFPHVKRLVDATLACKRILVSSDMELHAALDATSTLPSTADGNPEILEQYTWAKSGMRPDRPASGSVQIHVNRHAEIIFGLEGHSTLGPHLIHLDLRDPDGFICLSVEECQVALSNFPQLEFCALHVGESMDEVAEPLALMRLRTLSLSWTEGVEVASLLDSITAPSLCELELRGPLFAREYFVGHRWTSLRDFLRQSSPQLLYLTLARMDCTTLDIVACLALCDGLQHLSLEECRLDEELMDSLQHGDDPTLDRAVRTLMGLDYLGLISCDVFGLDDFLRDSLDSHIWLVVNLTRLYIINCGNISEEVLTAMKELPLEEFETDVGLLEEMLP